MNKYISIVKMILRFPIEGFTRVTRASLLRHLRNTHDATPGFSLGFSNTPAQEMPEQPSPKKLYFPNKYAALAQSPDSRIGRSMCTKKTIIVPTVHYHLARDVPPCTRLQLGFPLIFPIFPLF